MCNDDIEAIMNYAVKYDEALIEMFESIGITFIDCEVGSIDEDDHIFDEDIPQ